MDKGDDPYKILGVADNASAADIKKAYRKLALQNHPDRQKTAEDRERANAVFSKISNAYEILSDEQQRRNYDMQQQYGGGKGYDPNGPTYREATPPQASTRTTQQTASPKQRRSCQSKPTRVKTTTYKTSSSEPRGMQSGQPMSFTFSTSTADDDFKDPFEMFKKVFGKEFEDSFSSDGYPTSPSKKKSTASSLSPRRVMMSNTPVRRSDKTKAKCSKLPTVDIDSPNQPMSMSSSTRTVQHSNGQVETITETVITRADGTTERKVESRMSNPTSPGSRQGQRQRQPIATSSTKQAAPKKHMTQKQMDSPGRRVVRSSWTMTK